MSKKVGVILSGCGVFDGAEIHESVITLLELDKAGAEVSCFAPDIPQLKVVDHLCSKDTEESRNVLVESARIARGQIAAVTECKADDFDALILPGGFGAALNHCTFAVNGPAASIDEGVKAAIQSFYEAGKPVGAMCIAPATLALALQNEGIKLTIGSDEGVAGGIVALGNKHIDCVTSEIVTDEDKKIVTTPAYMTAGGIAEAWEGISKLVAKVLELA